MNETTAIEEGILSFHLLKRVCIFIIQRLHNGALYVYATCDRAISLIYWYVLIHLLKERTQ